MADCREVQEYLPSYADGTGARHISVEEHLRSCASCRSELEAYRSLVTDMAILTESVLEPPAWLEGTLLDTVTERARRNLVIRDRASQLTDPKVITGGAVVVAGVVGAMMLRGRRRRRSRSRRLLQALSG